MRFLTTLHLSHLSITRGFVEFMLSRCSLEKISISWIRRLKGLRIKDLSSKLKYLEIWSCYDLKELELDARELVCFSYRGRRTNITYTNVPSLVEVKFSTYNFDGWGPCFWHLIECLSNQLFKLSLDLEQATPDKLNFGGFPNLKYLDMSVSGEGYLHIDYKSLFVACISVASVCPMLLEFKLEVEWKYLGLEGEFDDYELGIEEDTKGKQPRTGKSCECLYATSNAYGLKGASFETRLTRWASQVGEYSPKKALPKLRCFKLVGFIGKETDVRIVMHIVEAAPKLSRICLDLSPLHGRCCKHQRKASKERARKLSLGFPSSIDVEIL